MGKEMSEVDVMLKAGLSFHERGELEQANHCYQRVLALDPAFAKAWHLSGRLALDAGLLNEAESFVARATELSPEVADYALTMGTVLAIGGQNSEARVWYEKALELNGSMQEAYLGIAQTMWAERNFGEARALAEPLSNMQGPLGLSARSLVGECRFELEDLQGVFKWWRGVSGVDLSSGMVLHVGCGRATLANLPAVFQNGNWGEIRLDIDPAVNPDVIASVSEMSAVERESVQAVYSCHNIEHLFHHEVPFALKEFHRTLVDGGALVIRTPDLQAACAMVAEDRLYDTAYVSGAGPIAPIDMIYSYRKFLLDNNVFMLHKTGFTATTLRDKLKAAGFRFAFVRRTHFELYAVGLK
jgi:predicted SAM-dependent methyltransferase/Tfp pilus assembly protein PilF